ncbi:MAG: cytochrome b [Proteobacteria bacterium]|nr:cytochrome b [Pseudomonadota bacterium]
MTTTSYTRTAILLHWSIAVLIFLNIAGGFLMASTPKQEPQHDAILFWHASLGSLIFLLAVVRLCWRLTHQPPPLPDSIPALQRGAAHALHWLLYILMLVLPFSGYLHRLAGGHDVSFFGLFNWPAIIAKDEPFRLFTHSMHEALAWTLCILLAGHIAAALKHALVDRDGVLRRILVSHTT